VRTRAEDAAEERLLDALLPPARTPGEPSRRRYARQVFRKKLREGELDAREIEIEVQEARPQLEIMGPAGHGRHGRAAARHVQPDRAGAAPQAAPCSIAEARRLLIDEEAAKLVNEEEIKTQAIANAEQNGIVFIDEIDKVATRQETSGADVSRQGVQRDLLPLVEGTTVSTKYGMVKTDHILFIASGAFPSGQAQRPDPRVAGAVSDPRGARIAVGAGF
jgi:ATP-dependent HslUV protease ATP-binding subunit HslU